VSVAACLLLYAVLAATVAPPLLSWPARTGWAPRAAVAAWLAVVGSVVTSWTAGAVGMTVDVVDNWRQPDPMGLSVCLARLFSVSTGTGLLIEAVLATLSLTVAVVAAVRVIRVMHGGRVRGRRHAESARMVGRQLAGLDGILVEAPNKLVYCVGGKAGVVVVTSAALDALSRPQLLAVLDHERAHVSGGHHGLIAVTKALAAAMPRMKLFTVAHADIAQLVEMCADDAAARRHGTPVLLAAMLALAGGGPMPVGALGANGIGIVGRVNRLHRPGTATQRWGSRITLAASSCAFIAAPLWVAVGLGTCVLMVA